MPTHSAEIATEIARFYWSWQEKASCASKNLVLPDAEIHGQVGSTSPERLHRIPGCTELSFLEPAGSGAQNIPMQATVYANLTNRRLTTTLGGSAISFPAFVHGDKVRIGLRFAESLKGSAPSQALGQGSGGN